MSKKTKEDLDFEALDWQYVIVSHFLIPLPHDWTVEIDKDAGKVRGYKGKEAKLTVSLYSLNGEKKENLSESLQKFGKAYEENNFDLCSGINNAGAFLFQYHSFEGEPLMLIALTEKEYQGKLYHIFFVFRTENRAALKKYMMHLYHIVKRTSIALN